MNAYTLRKIASVYPDKATQTTARREIVPVINPEAMATEPQKKFLRSLCDQKDYPADRVGLLLKWIDEDTLTKRQASYAIDILKRCPDKPKTIAPVPAPTTAPEITDGIYRDPSTGHMYKVQYNRASGDGRRLYAKRAYLETAQGGMTEIPLSGYQTEKCTLTWEYAAGAMKSIKPEWRLNERDARTFGALYGICSRCGRDLTDESSIRSGMGKVCAGKQWGA